jgi:hypothetical protein
MVISLVLCLACTHRPQVRATLDEVLADPEQYEDTDLIVTASIKDLLENPSRYKDYWIEVSGELGYYGWRSFWTWYCMVGDGESELRCYTRYYRVSIGRDAGVMMRRASSREEPVTVNGYLKNDGLDIREIIYDGDKVMPAFKPPCMPIVPGRVN